MSEEQVADGGHQCQCCGGGGGGVGRPNFGYDEALGQCRTGEYRWMECRYCSGTGRWTDERLAAWEAGQAFKIRRMERGELIYHQAKRLGLRPSDISKIDHGELPVPEGE